MAARTIINEIERILKKHSDSAVRKEESKNFAHIAEFTAFESAGAFEAGTQTFINKLPDGDLKNVLNEANSKFSYQMVISEIFTDIISGALKLKGTKTVKQKAAIRFKDFFVSGPGSTTKQFSIMPGSNPNRLILQVDSANATNRFTIFTVCTEMRKEIFHRWLRKAGKSLTAQEAVSATKDIANSTDYSHKSRTIGRAGFQNFVEEVVASKVFPKTVMNVTITSMDLLKYIVSRSNMEYSVDFTPEYQMGTGQIPKSQTRKLTVKGLVQSQGTKRADDWMARKDKGGGVKKLVQDGAIEFLRKNLPEHFEGEKKTGKGTSMSDAVGATGSPSFEEETVSGAIQEITKKAKPKKRVKNKTVTIKTQPKVRKRTKESINVSSKGSAPKAVTTSISIKLSATGRLRKQKEVGKKELNLGKVKTSINRKLGAEIRRNMGRPALINQTGRFSDSAELVSLRQAQNSKIGTYNYQLRPYETFENNGDRQWPAGFNPKPLIAKSIRNLAVGTITDKFILRRG